MPSTRETGWHGFDNDQVADILDQVHYELLRVVSMLKDFMHDRQGRSRIPLEDRASLAGPKESRPATPRIPITSSAAIRLDPNAIT